MKLKNTARLFALTGIAAVLAACGGNDGDATAAAPAAAPAPAVVPTTTPVAVTVIDGAIRNALVCLDKNQNSNCDADEPSGRTDAAGNVTLQVLNADAARYPVLAIVGTDAVDVDHGAVPTAFKMKAPADRASVVSPLTTLVQSTIETTGASSASAEAAVKTQLGVSGSLFEDFTKSTTENLAASATAKPATLGAIARMIVVTTQEQVKSLASAAGTKAIDGSTITANDIEQAVQRKLLEVLPEVVAKTADIPAGRPISTLAQEIVASPTAGLDAAALATLVAVAKQTDKVEAPLVEAVASLRQLNFTDSANWLRRVFTSTAQQATPDSSNNVRYNDQRTRSTQGVLSNWSVGGSPAGQIDQHWNGTGWVGCGLNQENTSSLRDAFGNSTYDFCDKRETGRSAQATFDVSGRAMIDVYNEVVNGRYDNLTIANPSTALGTTTFPAGSKVSYNTSTPLVTNPAYNSGLGNRVRNNPANLVIGRTDPTVAGPCDAAFVSNTEAGTLESIVAANPGTPCIQPANGSAQSIPLVGGTFTTLNAGPRNEAWGNSTLSIGVVGNAPTGVPQAAATASYYTTNSAIRLAFTANNGVRYFNCKQRATDASPRNCDAIGTGTYSIAQVGDARVMTLANAPVQASGLTYDRVFVERAGKVYFGYKTKSAPTKTARLNATAMNALFAKLGLPAVDPGASFSLTSASYAGEWLFSNPTQTTGKMFGLRLNNNFNPAAPTSFQCVDYPDGPFSMPTPFGCTMQSFNAQTGAFSATEPSNGQTFSGVLTFNTGAATATYTNPVENVVGGRR